MVTSERVCQPIRFPTAEAVGLVSERYKTLRVDTERVKEIEKVHFGAHFSIRLEENFSYPRRQESSLILF